MSAVVIFMSFIGLLVGSLVACTYAVKKGLKPAKAVVMQICSFTILVVGFSAAAALTSAESNVLADNPALEQSVEKSDNKKNKDDKEENQVSEKSAVAERTTSNKDADLQEDEDDKSSNDLDGIAMALAIGLASIGSGLAVAAAAPAAIGAVSEDPKAFGKAIVFVGLAEGVAIFALLVVIFIKFL